MTLRLDDALHEHLAEAAEREHRSLHAEIVVRLERSLGGSVERGATAPAVAVVPDTPESVAVKAKRARAVMEQAQKALAPREHPEDQGAIHTPPEVIEQMEREAAEESRPEPAGAPATKAPAEDKPTPPPPPSSPPRKSIDEVLGDPKHKAKGTVSGRQALLAHEAQLRAQSREDLFSLVCPSRDDHVVGVRCPLCKGIR